MHSAGACVESRIVAPRRLLDSLGIGRQLIPETIQVDAFAALDQPLNVRSAEIEVPQSRAADDFVPGADSRQWRVDHDPACYTRRTLCSKRVTNHVADVMRDESSCLDLQLVHHLRDIEALRFLVVSALRM